MTQPDGPADRRIARHSARRDEIIQAAWSLARAHGLDGIPMRTLADRVGLRQPSLYQYFASKEGLFDAMFAEGNRQLLQRMRALVLPEDPVAALRVFAKDLTAFSVEDPLRYQLMFQRNIPGFQPSRESYALAEEFYDWATVLLKKAGLGSRTSVDLFTAFSAGLVEQQLANDPGGRRWIRHMDTMLDMLLRHAAELSTTRRRGRHPTVTR